MDATPVTDPEPPVLELSTRLSEGQANAIYAAAYHLSERGKHDQACALFALLGMYEPQEPKYAHATGMCFRRMGQYEQAIPLFARAMALRPNDYAPAFQLVECMMLLNKRNEAKELLEMIAGASREQGQPQTTMRAKAIMDLITERKS